MSFEESYSDPGNSYRQGSLVGSVSVLEAYRRLWSNFANFRTRSSRAEYWKVVVANLILFFVVIVLDVITRSSIFTVVYLLYGLIALIPSLALTVRRLHDSDHSGGWIFISLIPVAGSLVLLVFMLTRSTPGPNRYGLPSGS